MTDFKSLKSIPVKTISGNRSGNSFEGQLYYDSDGVGAFKFLAPELGAWASGGALNNARSQIVGAGIQTAAIAFGGEPPPGSPTRKPV